MTPRLGASLFGASVLVAGALLVLRPPQRRIAAPSCEHAPLGCTVTVDEVSTALPLALLAVGTLLLLMAITGRMWIVTFGDHGVRPEPQVAPSTAGEVESKASSTETASPSHPSASTENSTGPDASTTASLEAFTALYQQDVEVADALEEAWREWYGISVADRVIDSRRATGKGNHSWYVKALDGDDTARWTRISRGGRSGGITTSRQ
ncbi:MULTISPECIES: hypothetical protein [unclassified Aeromicrobium]|uniref:hypothetical protein n=1 Tax=unclassified Aeromicrobium TaxID=2633570 RepID=UPI00288BB118|nr:MULTISPECIES: hypothetical protein [unclassified Aeromicrobium]